MKANSKKAIENRKVEKIQVTITVDKPDPMPFMLNEEVGTGKYGDKEVNVSRNISGSLLMITIGGVGYVVEVSEIVKGIGDHEVRSS